MPISQGASEKVWIQQFLNELLPENAVKEMKMFDNNKTSFTLTRDFENQNQIKHNDVIYHHVRGLVKDAKMAIN